MDGAKESCAVLCHQLYSPEATARTEDEGSEGKKKGGGSVLLFWCILARHRERDYPGRRVFRPDRAQFLGLPNCMLHFGLLTGQLRNFYGDARLAKDEDINMRSPRSPRGERGSRARLT